LRRRIAVEKKVKPRTRLLIALHRKKSEGLDEIADACSVPRRTVHGTLQRFQERGIDAAYSIKQTGRPKRLSQKQLHDLRKRLTASPHASGFKESFWTTRMVVDLVNREYGAEYTPQWMWNLLYDLGFHARNLGQGTTRPPRKTRKRLKKSAARDMPRQKERRTVFCLDECSFVVSPHIVRGWFRKDRPAVVKTNYTREKFHAIGVVNGRKEHYSVYDKINSKKRLVLP